MKSQNKPKVKEMNLTEKTADGIVLYFRIAHFNLGIVALFIITEIFIGLIFILATILLPILAIPFIIVLIICIILACYGMILFVKRVFKIQKDWEDKYEKTK